VDYSADTDEKCLSRATRLLRELCVAEPEYVIDGVRPDADLLQTCAVDEPRISMSGNFLVTGLSTQTGARMSAVVRDYDVVG
jgi:hypothetical protein